MSQDEPRSKHIDRRASSNTSDAPKTQIREDGSLRRGATGGRTFADFFSQENRLKPIVRGDLLGFIEAMEYHRWRNRWYRRLVAFLTRQPTPNDIPLEMGRSFKRRVIDPTVGQVEALDRGDV